MPEHYRDELEMVCVFVCIQMIKQISKLALIFLLLLTAVPSFAATAWPLKISANGRYFLDQNNAPTIMIGDAEFSAVSQLTTGQLTTLFSDRQSKGFNSVLVALLCTSYTGCASSGQTAGGISPFTSGSSPSNYDLSTPNSTYFALYTAAVSLAASYGLEVIIDPIETGGWLTTLQNNGDTKAYNYGVYIGNLFKGYTNVPISTGNDFGTYTLTSDNTLVGEVMAGIASVDTSHLQTIELGSPGYLTNSDNYSNLTPDRG